MSELLKRLYNITRSYIPKRNKLFNTGTKRDTETETDPFEYKNTNKTETFSSGTNAQTTYADYPEQIIEDLANFNLVPPSSLEEVRKARNREIKKYHPDRHMNDSEKRKTAKEILQIYNASYERLKAFFEKRK